MRFLAVVAVIVAIVSVCGTLHVRHPEFHGDHFSPSGLIGRQSPRPMLAV